MLISRLRFKPVINTIEYISLWAILLSILVSCKPPQIETSQVSQRKVGKTIYITGKVAHLAPFIDRAAYQIEDSTGRIWVVTQKKAPALGQIITIKGKIEYQSLPFAERELGDFYLIELEQLPPEDLQ